MDTWLPLLVGPAISGAVGAVPILVLLQWRMKQVERGQDSMRKGQERLADKLDAIAAPVRLKVLEDEMHRSRERLHRLEGRPSSAVVAADLIEFRTDVREEVRALRDDVRSIDDKLDGFITDYRQKG